MFVIRSTPHLSAARLVLVGEVELVAGDHEVGAGGPRPEERHAAPRVAQRGHRHVAAVLHVEGLHSVPGTRVCMCKGDSYSLTFRIELG